jgi:hypothetical protein
LSRRATQKPSSLVKKLWTTRLPCGSPRKTKNEYFQNDSPARPFNNLHNRNKIRGDADDVLNCCHSAAKNLCTLPAGKCCRRHKPTISSSPWASEEPANSAPYTA